MSVRRPLHVSSILYIVSGSGIDNCRRESPKYSKYILKKQTFERRDEAAGAKYPGAKAGLEITNRPPTTFKRIPKTEPKTPREDARATSRGAKRVTRGSITKKSTKCGF